MKQETKFLQELSDIADEVYNVCEWCEKKGDLTPYRNELVCDNCLDEYQSNVFNDRDVDCARSK